jgi:hypothetical protein
MFTKKNSLSAFQAQIANRKNSKNLSGDIGVFGNGNGNNVIGTKSYDNTYSPNANLGNMPIKEQGAQKGFASGGSIEDLLPTLTKVEATYRVKVTNTTSTDVANVSLFFANNNLFGGSYGTFGLNAAVVVTVDTTSYRQLLTSTLATARLIKDIKFFFSASDQLYETILMKWNTANGVGKQIPLRPSDAVDGYMQDSLIVNVKDVYFPLTGETEFLFTLKGSQSFTMLLYLSAQVDPANILQASNALSIVK